MDTVLIGAVLTLYTIINIVVPLSGSATATPILSLLTEPHKAIGLAVFYFFVSSVIRFFFFRRSIVWSEVKYLLIPSAIAAFIGSLSLLSISSDFLYIIILVSAVYFLFKKLNIIRRTKDSKHTTTFIGATSGFLQGAGLAGSDLRNSYLYSRGLDIAQVHGTTTTIAIVNFFIATTVRLSTKQIHVADLSPILLAFPFMILGVWGGKLILNKIDRTQTDRIVVTVMMLIIASLCFKVFTT